MNPFLPGFPFYATFQTPLGDIDLLAEVEVEGSRLRLKKISISPSATDFLPLGTENLLKIVSEIEDLAKLYGFVRVDFEGIRETGPRKGRLAFAGRVMR